MSVRIWVRYTMHQDALGAQPVGSGWELLDLENAPWSEEDFFEMQRQTLQKVHDIGGEADDVQIMNWVILEHRIDEVEL